MNVQPSKKSRDAWSVKNLITFDPMFDNLARSGRRQKQLVSVLADFFMSVACLWVAYSLRFGIFYTGFVDKWHIFMTLPVLTVVIFKYFGVYRWVIRSANLRLYRQLLKSSLASGVVLLVFVSLFPGDGTNPRSLFVIYGLLLFIGSCCLRAFWMAWHGSFNTGEPIAIYGAGAGGQQLASLLQNNERYRPVVFIDDDIKLQESTLQGLPVVWGQSSDLAGILGNFEVGKVVLAMPQISAAGYHRKVQQLEKTRLPVLTMPSIEELMSGSARVDEIRDVSISDILGRTEVAPDPELIGRRVFGKSVLITGGGGSIGSELCRQVLKLEPSRLVILDNCEEHLYNITEELSRMPQGAVALQKRRIVPLLGSVLDRTRLDNILKDHEVDTIYHAAAYKHVPIVEAQPEQGVEVNVFGTLAVLDSAFANAVSDFVLISTDKAVRPTNAMGASKRVAELILQAKSENSDAMRISMVRFGNVLGSSGSVVPKFKRQILENGPITLTHNDVTRYFMTIPEAAQLVLQASAIAEGGEVFVLDMGEPVRISDLARTMVHLYGKKLREETGNPADIEIVVNGLRPGEKLYEELFISDTSEATEVKKVHKTKEVWLEWPQLELRLEELSKLSIESNSTKIRSLLLELAFIDGKVCPVPTEKKLQSATRFNGEFVSSPISKVC